FSGLLSACRERDHRTTRPSPAPDRMDRNSEMRLRRVRTWPAKALQDGVSIALSDETTAHSPLCRLVCALSIVVATSGEGLCFIVAMRRVFLDNCDSVGQRNAPGRLNSNMLIKTGPNFSQCSDQMRWLARTAPFSEPLQGLKSMRCA